MGILFKKKDDNKFKGKKSDGFLKYALPIGLGLIAKSQANKRKEIKSSPQGEKVLGGLFRKKVKDDNKVLGGLFRKTGKSIFKKK
ncbi:MAG: hypothetical protein PUG67_02995 [Peptoniphilaceae bacterium]|nr:hypothetical protein [Peptoniphilaceae bacterium]MDY6019041.1 hypothetical protein [Anaerococcus sp.]